MPTYTVFDPMVTAYKAQIAKDCPTCSVTEDDFTLPQMLGGELVPAVVSAAKRIPDLKYIVSVDGAFTDTLPGALKAAGLAGKYQIINGGGIATDQQFVLAGTQLATVSGPFILGGWQDMDMAIRFAMHLAPSPGDNAVPWVLLNKSNIGTPSIPTTSRPITRACSRSSGTSADAHHRGRRRLPLIESSRVRSDKRHVNSQSFYRTVPGFPVMPKEIT